MSVCTAKRYCKKNTSYLCDKEHDDCKFKNDPLLSDKPGWPCPYCKKDQKSQKRYVNHIAMEHGD